MTTAKTPDQILHSMERFCAYRERCPQEVWRKLKELGAHGLIADQIYQVLEGDGYVDAFRFATAFAGGKFRINQWGKMRIRQALHIRDIPPAFIEQALQDAIPEDDYNRLVEKLIAKKKTQWAGEPNVREKTIAALNRAGFELDVIFRYL